MKRFLAPALILGVCSTFGLIGCAEETKVKEQTEVTTPGGSVTKTNETTIEKTGDAKTGEVPPATPPVETSPPK